MSSLLIQMSLQFSALYLPMCEGKKKGIQPNSEVRNAFAFLRVFEDSCRKRTAEFVWAKLVLERKCMKKSLKQAANMDLLSFVLIS